MRLTIKVRGVFLSHFKQGALTLSYPWTHFTKLCLKYLVSRILARDNDFFLSQPPCAAVDREQALYHYFWVKCMPYIIWIRVCHISYFSSSHPFEMPLLSIIICGEFHNICQGRNYSSGGKMTDHLPNGKNYAQILQQIIHWSQARNGIVLLYLGYCKM